MIALPGLTLATKRIRGSAEAFFWPSRRASIAGMLPNRFPDAGEKSRI